MGIFPHRISLLLLAALFFSSCRQAEVVFIDDPYRSGMESDIWGPETALFRFRARLRGIRFQTVELGRDTQASEYVASLKPVPDVVVLSPWHAASYSGSIQTDYPIVLYGGYAPKGTQSSFIDFHSRRGSDLMEQIGRKAGELAGNEEGEIILLYETGVPNDDFIRQIENALSKENPLRPINIMTVDRGGTLPEGFAALASGAVVGIFLAGELNLKAYEATGEAGFPVITEFAGGTTERIKASVENDYRRRAGNFLRLLDVLAKKEEVPESFTRYPQRLKE